MGGKLKNPSSYKLAKMFARKITYIPLLGVYYVKNSVQLIKTEIPFDPSLRWLPST
jgi:hypothetical protein